MRRILQAILFTTLLVQIFASTARADIIIVGPTNTQFSDIVTGCPSDCFSFVFLTPDPIVHVAAPTAGGLLDRTFVNDRPPQPAVGHPGYVGWTLQFGSPLNGTLNIENYLAHNFGNCTGGSIMDATYTPGDGDPANLTFINLFTSNSPSPTAGGTHIDPFPNDDMEPFYYTATERASFGLAFHDMPRDPCPEGCNGEIRTQFQTYLVSFDPTTETVTAHDGWMWGYDLVCTTPEPYTVTVVSIGLLVLVYARTRANRQPVVDNCEYLPVRLLLKRCRARVIIVDSVWAPWKWKSLKATYDDQSLPKSVENHSTGLPVSRSDETINIITREGTR